MSAALDLPGQLYNDNLVESNSLLRTYVPLPDALTGPVPGTAKEIHLVRQQTASRVDREGLRSGALPGETAREGADGGRIMVTVLLVH